MPHPPLAVPKVGRGMENQILETLQAMHEIGAEIARVKPDTIIFITPHGTSFADYFYVAGGESAEGNFARFGAESANYSAKFDTKLVAEISRIASEKNFPAGTHGNAEATLDHGVLVPMHFINAHFRDYKTVCVSQSGLNTASHFKFGEIIAQAVENSGVRAVIVASGDLSHKLGGANGFAPEGEIFDRDIMNFLGEGNFDAMLSMCSTLRENAAECGYGSFAILAGCFADTNRNIFAQTLSYESPFGVGYGVVRFTCEDAFRALARKSLEFRVKTGNDFEVDVFVLSSENPMFSRRAGAFVSLHMNGHLRGCIGTIAPSTASIAEEIVQNAVSAGLYDNRFPPVSASELPYITYKVDILDEPEEISGAHELDVKKYGVIVQSGFKRGLLLPNLDGIDSVQMQIDIACQKAGITPQEKISMQRFKVTRYE
jgi:AmmeMemoRadiSam system protein A